MKVCGHWLVVAAVGTPGMAGRASADDATITSSDSTMSFAPYYRSQELSLDMFGTGSIREQTIDHLSSDRVRPDYGVGRAGRRINF